MTNDASRQTGLAGAPDWDAIARFLAGESPDEEAVRVRTWLDANPADKALVERLGSIVSSTSSTQWTSATSAARDVDVEAALQRVHSRMDKSPNAPRFSLERGGGARRWRAAAITTLLVAAAASFAAITLRREPAKTPATTVAAAHTYTTKTGQRDSVMLTDGSRVILGPESRLTVPADYGTTVRSVALAGDAYFDVRHDATKSFTVRVANAIVEDIGTTFTVESDATDTIAVSVMSGSVRLRSSDSPATAGAVIGAGDRGSLTVTGQVHAHRHAVRADDAAWTTGKLTFHEASVARVVGEIRRWYGVRLYVADSSLLSQHVTIKDLSGEPIDRVLKIVALSVGGRVERQGDSATIHSIRK